MRHDVESWGLALGAPARETPHPAQRPPYCRFPL